MSNYNLNIVKPENNLMSMINNNDLGINTQNLNNNPIVINSILNGNYINNNKFEEKIFRKKSDEV